jgi:Rad3-related DNA helicase
MRICENTVFVSVRDLIEFILKRGSLDSSSMMSASRAVLGTKAHKKVQKSMGDNYTSEVILQHACSYDDVSFVIEGRADGIIENIDLIIIDEIKSTTTSLDVIEEDYNPLHLAQVKCYAFMYAFDKKLGTIGAQLTYYNLDTKETKRFLKLYDYEELETFFNDMVAKYAAWIRFYINWCSLRDASLKSLVFPFDTYRAGQRELAVHVYKSIVNKTKLFVNAPTGIGKTISTLFPSLKAMGEGQASKIFYITAKTITRTVAENAMNNIHLGGTRIKCITLTAKDKICFCETTNCTPSHCQHAEGHFDRVNAAIWDALNNSDLFTRDVIESFAKKHRVCPFEFALDLALWVDVIICDYNYIFDPTVALKRFLDARDYILLVDEAHNLVDRARDMFSASLSKRKVLAAKKDLPKSYSAVKTSLTKINSYLLDIKKDYFENDIAFIKKDMPKDIYPLLRTFINLCDKQFQKTSKSAIDNDLLDLYFEIYGFLKLFEFYDEKYITYANNESGDVVLKLFCIDPSYLLGEIMTKFKSVILFSATLLPIDYYKYLLCGMNDTAIRLDSPFDKSKALRLIASDVSTRYQDRANSYSHICQYIKQVVDNHLGNYFVFFPSYKYLMDVYTRFVEMYGTPYAFHIQSSNMDESERESFLSQFEENPRDTHIGFCVLGGIFSEGIDLKYDRLIGVIIIGVGLPQLCLERSLIENYFNELGKDGYHYAYTYPGINKVFQAAGRLIRTEQDAGIILLIDDRFNNALYKNLFPAEWTPYYPVTIDSISHFWGRFSNLLV